MQAASDQVGLVSSARETRNVTHWQERCHPAIELVIVVSPLGSNLIENGNESTYFVIVA